MREMNRKCQSRSGFLNNYAFGVRHEVYKRHHKEPGFNLRATDLLPPPPRADLDEVRCRVPVPHQRMARSAIRLVGCV